MTWTTVTIYAGEASPKDVLLYELSAPVKDPPVPRDTLVTLYANQDEAAAGAAPEDLVVSRAAPWSAAKAFGTLTISGVTKDGTGSPVGGCTVDLYETANKVRIATTVSGEDGAFQFSSLASGLLFFVVAYKDAAPDLAGTTIHDLAAS